MKSKTFFPLHEPAHNSNTELSSCHLLLLCGNTEDSAWEKVMTLGNIFDGNKTLIILLTELSCFCTAVGTWIKEEYFIAHSA